MNGDLFDHGGRDWTAHAACVGVDPDLFFPDRGASVFEAKKVCAGCPVRQACLDYALDKGEKFGIWGGTSERERRRIRRALGAKSGRPRTHLAVVDGAA